MVEYLEKMNPRADLSFFGLGNGFGGKDLEFRDKGKGREEGRERCNNVWEQSPDLKHVM